MKMQKHLISFEEARKDPLSCAVYLTEKIKSRREHAAAVEALVNRHIEKGDVDMAAALADSVADPYVRDRLLACVIVKCIDKNDDDYAFQLVGAVEEPQSQAAALESIALQKAAKGEVAKAIEVAEELDHSSNAFAGIAVSQAKAGDNLLAMQTLERVDFYNFRVDALQEIASNYIRQDKTEKAIQMLDKAVLEASHIEFTEDRIRSMLELGLNFIEGGRKDKAIETFGKTNEIISGLKGSHKDNLFAQAAIGFLKAGSVDLADRVLDSVSDKAQIANCLVGFSQFFSNEGESQEAIETIEEAYAILKSQVEGEIRDSQFRYKLFASIAVQFAQLKKFEQSIDIACKNPDMQQKNRALVQIAQTCALNDSDELIPQVLRYIEENSQRVIAMIAISDAKNTIGKKDDALKMLAGISIDKVLQLKPKAEFEQELAERFYAYGEVEKARELISNNMQTIKEMSGDGDRSIALIRFSSLFNKLNFEMSENELDVLHTLVKNSDLI